jgi:hypothetical protein
MDPALIPYAYAGSLLVSLLLLAASWRWPNVGRLLFVLLFAWASQQNLRTALRQPGRYLDFAQYAYLALYREFILGPFARHVTPIVVAIAAGQLLIALLLLGTTRPARLGLAGGIVFLLAIAPLGTGAAFPATVLGALGLALLWRRPFARSLPGVLAERLGRFGVPPD